MSAYLGDFALGKTFDFKFTTITPTTGAPITFGDSPAVAAYPGNSGTEVTAGITLSVDFDGVTGLHNVRIVATSGNGYATATNYAVVVTVGTVDGVSAVGYVLAHFSIEARSALRPATADRTLVVDAAGLADATAVKVGPSGSGTAQTAGDIIGDTNDIQARLPAALTSDGLMKADTLRVGGTLQTAGDIIGDTNDIQTRLPAALVSGRMDASVGAMAANVMTAAATAADYVTELQAGLALEATAQAIKTKTDALPSDPADQSAVEAAITAAEMSIEAAIAALNNLSAAQVKAQVVAALATDTYAEPTGVPAATATLATKIGRLHQALRNGLTVTATDKTFQDDGGSDLWKKPLSDDGTTYIEGEGTAP